MDGGQRSELKATVIAWKEEIMPTKDELMPHLEQLATDVSDARAALLKGELKDIKKINERLEHYCQEALELDPEEIGDVKPILDDILLDLKTFAEEVNYIQKKVEEIHRQQAEEAANNTSD